MEAAAAERPSREEAAAAAAAAAVVGSSVAEGRIRSQSAARMEPRLAKEEGWAGPEGAA